MYRILTARKILGGGEAYEQKKEKPTGNSGKSQQRVWMSKSSESNLPFSEYSLHPMLPSIYVLANQF